MRYSILITLCFLVLLTCTSCIFDSKEDNPKEHYLKGTIKDTEGNILSDASIYIVFDPILGKEALPKDDASRELVSFTVSLNDEADILLNWTVTDETNVLGYRIYRSEIYDFQAARSISPIIVATHETQAHSYSMLDDSYGNHTYYYWLEANCQQGQTYYYGPEVITVTNPDYPPEFPINSMPAYPNPFSTLCTIYYPTYSSGSTALSITNAYTGSLFSYLYHTIYSNRYRLEWSGEDNDENDLCNGVYQVQAIAKDSTGHVRSDKTINILKNKTGLQNAPVCYSTSTGYKIPFNKYFQFGKVINLYDAQGNTQTAGTIKGNFTIYVKKTGYVTASEHILFRDYQADYSKDFNLRWVGK